MQRPQRVYQTAAERLRRAVFRQPQPSDSALKSRWSLCRQQESARQGPRGLLHGLAVNCTRTEFFLPGYNRRPHLRNVMLR